VLLSSLVTVVPCVQATLIFEFAQASRIAWLQVNSHVLWLALLVEVGEIALGVTIVTRVQRTKRH
jgi:hypothetical protein